VRFSFAGVLRCGAIALLSVLVLGLPAVAQASDPPNIHVGSNGHWVRVAQQDLTDLGYSLPITGIFGAHTKAEVNAFKKAHRLPRNGQVDWPQAWKALRTAVKREQSRPWRRAHLNSKGLAVAPKDAPAVVKRAIAAANHIAFKPYCYAGGHGSWNSPCYDCSGSVSYALHGGGLLWRPRALFYTYGQSGWGKWIRIYTNSEHAYMKVAGLWFDTVAQQWGSPGHGDRWSTKRASPASGFTVRHPTGF
jgi:peptidoglycan hydrolase-like protein with peptidoglycan-binding domain